MFPLGQIHYTNHIHLVFAFPAVRIPFAIYLRHRRAFGQHTWLEYDISTKTSYQAMYMVYTRINNTQHNVRPSAKWQTALISSSAINDLDTQHQHRNGQRPEAHAITTDLISFRNGRSQQVIYIYIYMRLLATKIRSEKHWRGGCKLSPT